MAARGRPVKNGVKEARVLFRTMIALQGYDQSRSHGEKYTASLEAGIAAVRTAVPGMKMSMTEMKRVLAEFRSPDLAETFLTSENENTVGPNGRKYQKAWVLTVGATPEYPRHNARHAGAAKG
jgi:hypothetical protein